jgi:hypothetical protein
MSFVCSFPCVVNANERIMQNQIFVPNRRRNRVQGKFRLHEIRLIPIVFLVLN